MSDHISGFWEVGSNAGEVVVNIPVCKNCPKTCDPGGHHFAFSPDQARGLAKILNKHADAVGRRSRAVGVVKIARLERRTG